MQLAALVPALSEITKLERTIKTQQLRFDFDCEANDVDSNSIDAGKTAVAEPNSNSDAKQIRVLKRIPVGDYQSPKPTPQAASMTLEANPTVNLETVRRGQRYGAPMRMGAAMVAVLKRYGISDHEIQEGVEAFARKYQTAAAS